MAIVLRSRREGPHLFPVTVGLTLAAVGWLVISGMAGFTVSGLALNASQGVAQAVSPTTGRIQSTPFPPTASVGTDILPGANPTQDRPGFSPSQILPQLERFALHSHTAATGAAKPDLVAGRGASHLASSNSTAVTGYVTGYVANASDPSDFLSGVTVQAYSLGGAPCSVRVCTPTSTDANGYFRAPCLVGEDYVRFDLSWWAENQAYASCAANADVSVGTVLLYQDGVVTGTVLVDSPSHSPVAGVQVTGSSRDLSLVANPTVTTSSTGAFRVPVPPGIAARVDFAPPSASYASNFTYAMVGPGATVDLGIVYLEPNVVVEAYLFDAVTGQPIVGSFSAPDSLTVCSALTNVCGPQGPPAVGTNLVEAAGPPGYDVVDAVAVGYLENTTSIGWVPREAAGQAYCDPSTACSIYLVPLGGISLDVNVTGPPQNNTGAWFDVACSLDGYLAGEPLFNPATFSFNTTVQSCVNGGCASPNTGAFVVAGFPLRNTVRVEPDTSGVCGSQPTWPIPGDLPVWGNETVVNVTPDEVTPTVWLNLTPGIYLEGTVLTTGSSTSGPASFIASVTSRIQPTLSSYTYVSGVSPDSCPASGSTTFCVPAPPGPGTLTISAFGFQDNYTWVSVPWPSANHVPPTYLTLSQVTSGHLQSVNLTPLPSVAGTVSLGGNTGPVPYGTVQACPASINSAAACAIGAIAANGSFSIPGASPGWEVVKAAVTGFAPNSAAADLPASRSVGSIPLQPLALVAGQVDTLASNGSAVIDARVTYCAVAGSNGGSTCVTPLGSGLTTSSGQYLGYVEGGWLPWATYEIVASASGYVTDWTWVNATPGMTTRAPTLYLHPVGGTAVWVTGRFVDNRTGWGVSTQQIQLCPVSSAYSATCVAVTDGSNSGGYFNVSVPSGVYNLSVSAPGYFPDLLTVSALSGPHVDLGTILLAPLPWVNGTVTLQPWSTIAVLAPSGSLVNLTLGPPASVIACTASLACGPSVTDATDGAFSVPTYYGDYLELTASPLGGGALSASGGFVPGSLLFNGTGPAQLLSDRPVLPLAIFSAVEGKVVARGNTSSGRSVLVPWTNFLITTTKAPPTSVSGVTDAGGDFIALLPGDDPANTIRISVGASSLYFPNTTFVPTSLPMAGVVVAPPIMLTSFGWATARVVNSVTGQPAAYLSASASFYDPITGASASTAGDTNGAGFLNLSAPTGESVGFTIGGVEDYNATALQAPVTAGRTTVLPPGPSFPIRVEPWGWVASSQLQFNGPGSYAGTIFDPVVGRPVPFASVFTLNPDPIVAPGGGSAVSNSLGEFLADAPVGPHDILSVSATGFLTNASSYRAVGPGAFVTVDRINLTAEGILAGKVVATPGGMPVAGATVVACAGTTPLSGRCVESTTNASGAYWVAVPPGVTSVSVQAVDYTSNYTEFVTARSDQWISAPAYVVQEYGLIEGNVRGLPTGLPLPTATLTACPETSGVIGGCALSVEVEPNGTFSLLVPAGSYQLELSAPNYNSTSLSVSVVPGGTTPIGAVFLQEFGFVQGLVESAQNGAPVAGAVVVGCSVLSTLPCGAPATTNASGQFLLAVTPGRAVLSATAAGYAEGYGYATIDSGTIVTAPPVLVVPLGMPSAYPISGEIVRRGDGQPIGNATVSLRTGSATAYTTITTASGAFEMTVGPGSFTLFAWFPGYAAVRLPLTVSGPTAGLVVSLPLWEWNVTGQVVDGLRNTPIPGAMIENSAGLLATTNLSGGFSFPLPNGTYRLQVVGQGTSASEYAPLSLGVAVQGAPVTEMVTLYPPLTTVHGTVTGAGGGPVAAARLTFLGQAINGANVTAHTVAGPDGGFDVALYAGAYELIVNASGYASVRLSIVTPSTAPLSVMLSALTPPTEGGSIPPWILLGIGGGATVLIGGLIGRRRVRRRAKKNDGGAAP